MCSCYFTVECCNLFSGVKLSIRPFCFIYELWVTYDLSVLHRNRPRNQLDIVFEPCMSCVTRFSIWILLCHCLCLVMHSFPIKDISRLLNN